MARSYPCSRLCNACTEQAAHDLGENPGRVVPVFSAEQTCATIPKRSAAGPSSGPTGARGSAMLRKIAGVTILLAAALAFSAGFGGAGTVSASAQGADSSVPAYHISLPKGRLPTTMDPALFDEPIVRNAYLVVSRTKRILYQQPCYCHCDQHQGHTSLLDCFVSRHGSACDICVREALYSYEQSRKGKTAAQIREGIVRGEWQSVNLSKYETPLPTTAK